MTVTTEHPKLYKRLIYGLFSASWLTGTLFFILSRWVVVAGEFGPQKHPLQFPVLMVHGASAFLMIFMFGVAVASHAVTNWHLKTVRRISLLFIFLISVQMVTAYLLYYLANEQVREIVSNVHAFVGFALPIILIIHITQARRVRKKLAKLAYKA